MKIIAEKRVWDSENIAYEFWLRLGCRKVYSDCLIWGLERLPNSKLIITQTIKINRCSTTNSNSYSGSQGGCTVSSEKYSALPPIGRAFYWDYRYWTFCSNWVASFNRWAWGSIPTSDWSPAPRSWVSGIIFGRVTWRWHGSASCEPFNLFAGLYQFSTIGYLLHTLQAYSSLQASCENC